MAMSSADLAPSTMPEEAPQLGDGTSFKAQQQAYAQAGPPSQGGAPPTSPGAPPASQQGQPPVQPGPSMFQSSIAPQLGRPIDQSIQMGNVFQKPPTLQEPWRTWLRNQASRPGAGPEMQALAKVIDHQRGPLDKQQ